jgi:alcohol dehydrogenase
MQKRTEPTLPIAAFDWQLRTRLVFGPGTLEQVGTLAAGAGFRHALLVTDKGIASAGHADRARSAMEKAGVAVTLYDSVHENPATSDVRRCLAVAAAAKVDSFVGLGGGSSMDTAKGCNLLLTNGGEMKDYWGVGKATKPLMPLIAIPTTAGTGSECQSAALIADEVTHQKMACLDPKISARVAILDPELTLSQPPRVAACTGMDALSHAVETAVTRKRTAMSAIFSREAFRLCFEALPRVLADPTDLDARSRMQLGAAHGGTAIECSMLGAAHSAANPLTAHYKIAHGQAVGLVLPAIVRFNAAEPAAAAGYEELCRAVGLQGVEALASALEEILRLTGLSGPLSKFGVKTEAIPTLADEASQQWTATFNPRKIAPADFARLYESLLG